MGLKKIFAAVLLIGLVAIPKIAVGQGNEEDDHHFTIDVEKIAVPHGESGEWDGTYTDPGTVIFHDGKFHMFRNGFQAWPASVEIGYLTSDDGINWTEVIPDPVFYTADAPFNVEAALASSALVEEDGTWVLYFYLWPHQFGSTDPSSIARATAPAPEGPWTMDAEISLGPGAAASEWDSGGVSAPSVVKTDDGYLMFYAGFDIGAGGFGGIGMATSPDGITWTKYDDPATTTAPYAESDPVFLPSPEEGAWDSRVVHQPRVRLTPDGLVMLYRTFEGNGRNMAFGLAISQDGITWERIGTGPVFSSDETNLRGIWYSELEYRDGTYYGYFEIQRNYQNQTDIYVGTLTADLP
ncbi:MAG: hypothetical protein K8L91_22670 [Anaerolineae bacterium]|nr:hypothetical protein [Anaerolineae bacterium]